VRNLRHRNKQSLKPGSQFQQQQIPMPDKQLKTLWDFL
jgi:hypothetical protein